MAFVVVYDANVLFPAGLRDLLLEMARAGEFRARYTHRILDEAFDAVLRQRPDLDTSALARTRELVENAVPDAIVENYDALINAIELPDADDQHVLAAAIRAGAQVIVTENRKHFPAEALEPLGIEAQSADTFVHSVASLYPQIVVRALQTIASRLSEPPRTPLEILEGLERNGLVQTAALIKPLLPPAG